LLSGADLRKGAVDRRVQVDHQGLLVGAERLDFLIGLVEGRYRIAHKARVQGYRDFRAGAKSLWPRRSAEKSWILTCGCGAFMETHAQICLPLPSASASLNLFA